VFKWEKWLFKRSKTVCKRAKQRTVDKIYEDIDKMLEDGNNYVKVLATTEVIVLAVPSH
jgi:hypothetical protein